MTEYDKGVNMSSDSRTREDKIGDQAKYLGIKNNREPREHELTVAPRPGNPMSRAVDMVHRHNERDEHAPMIGGHKHEDGRREEMHHEHMKHGHKE